MTKGLGRRAEAAAAAEDPTDDAAQPVSPFKAWFGRAATTVSDATGSVWTFALAIAVIAGWAISGPVFGFSDTWQLVANTFTTLVTFLMVFLIQNTQNRDAEATQLKLDELIRSIGDARNRFIGAESEPEERIKRETKDVEAEKVKPASPTAREPRVDRPPHTEKPHERGAGRTAVRHRGWPFGPLVTTRGISAYGRVPPGEGKGWAQGRTANDDPRIAKAAAAHRGLTYTSHAAPEHDRRRSGGGRFDPTWTPTLAYAVGLIATDGGLVRGRSIAFPSADRELVEILLRCLGKSNTISVERTKTGGVYYRTQIGDVALYRWLLSIKIEPRKSLTIGAIDVPDEFFLPFARGLLDGDGSIMNKLARADTKRRSDYRWEYLQTKFVSASLKHVTWLRGRLSEATDLDGYLMTQRANGRRHACYALRFSKHASLRLLPLLYADPDAPRLTRKWRVWANYAARHGLAPHGAKLDKMHAPSPGGVTAASQV